MTNWVRDAKGITYPDGELQRVDFRISETGEIQINELVDVYILGLTVDDAIRALTEAKSGLVDTLLLSDTYEDADEVTIVDVYIHGWRAELSDFERAALTGDA